MGREEFEVVKENVLKRKVRRRMGLFIDATGLDRATRRLDKKIDLSRLVKGLSSGLKIEVARYYCLIPYEDDARQFSFLDAVERAGVEVITKRLPPKGVKRQVSMDVHIATDIMNFCSGKFAEEEATQKKEANSANDSKIIVASKKVTKFKRTLTVVCPSRELSYALYSAKQQGADTSLADFGQYGVSDGWKGVDKWIDMSTSETIWR